MFKNLFSSSDYDETLRPGRTANEISCELGAATLILGNAQHQGKRSYQEDSFGFSKITGACAQSRGVLAVLADGMGGLSNGKQVSDTAVTKLLTWFNDENTLCENSIHIMKAVVKINEDICDVYCDDGRTTAGSTLASAFIKGDMMSWVCIGDSRIYIKRNEKLFQINEDHDLLNDMLDQYIDGEYDKDDAFNDSQKDGLVSCIGKWELANIDYNKKPYQLFDGDIIVLCSDGIYNALTYEEFNSLVNEDAMECAQRIKDAVLDKNYARQDNLTIIVMYYKKER